LGIVKNVTRAGEAARDVPRDAAREGERSAMRFIPRQRIGRKRSTALFEVDSSFVGVEVNEGDELHEADPTIAVRVNLAKQSIRILIPKAVVPNARPAQTLAEVQRAEPLRAPLAPQHGEEVRKIDAARPVRRDAEERDGVRNLTRRERPRTSFAPFWHRERRVARREEQSLEFAPINLTVSIAIKAIEARAALEVGEVNPHAPEAAEEGKTVHARRAVRVDAMKEIGNNNGAVMQLGFHTEHHRRGELRCGKLRGVALRSASDVPLFAGDHRCFVLRACGYSYAVHFDWWAIGAVNLEIGRFFFRIEYRTEFRFPDSQPIARRVVSADSQGPKIISTTSSVAPIDADKHKEKDRVSGVSRKNLRIQASSKVHDSKHVLEHLAVYEVMRERRGI
jgi:hypothetical protein